MPGVSDFKFCYRMIWGHVANIFGQAQSQLYPILGMVPEQVPENSPSPEH